ncbi:D-2-hydroxyacid dehydrogenase [Paenibacillus septentrionalis]|uniref:D-2-hydroxyacid dehydrogenase n=1 Tax=Paenibacillus septentrionalis TaxID=429342 RepID=A0ABW1V1K4_9BACL
MSKPIVYIRCEQAEPYLDRIASLSKEVIVEPWVAGQAMPPMDVDLSEIDVVLTRGLIDNMSWLQEAKSLKWVHSLTVGVEKLPLPALAKRNIVVTNVKGINAIPISEYVLAGILTYAKGYFEFWSQQRQRIWQTREVKEISGSTIAILGFGHIGRAIAERAKALGMIVKAMGRSQHDSSYTSLVDAYFVNEQYSEVVADADYVVNCLPESQETFCYMNEYRFSLLKKGALFINVGRGSTVDEHALLLAAKEHLGGAILDVFQQEPLPEKHFFWNNPRIFVTPHNAFASPKHWSRVFEQFLQNLVRYQQGMSLENTVDPAKGY